MKRSILGLVAGASLLFALTGCGSQSPSTETSELNYITWSEGAVLRSTMADALNQSVRVCLRGRVSDADYERSKRWSRRAILTWHRTLKVIDDRVTSNITYTCDDSDLTFNLRNGRGTSYARPSEIFIYMSRPYGTWTHELGHALAALGDTYAGRQAGNCRRGQPESLMCWGAYGPRSNPDEFSTLWPDDIAGIQDNHLTITEGDLFPPEWADEVSLEAPLNPDAPWPNATAKVTGGLEAVDVVIDPALDATEIDYSRDTSSIDL